MKTFKLTIGLMLLGSAVFSQELTTKKGIPILPQKGDYALGIDALPFIRYAGNLLNGSTNNSAAFNLINGNTFTGKYYLTEKKALRFKLRLNTVNEALKSNVIKDGQYDSEITVTDIMYNSETNINLSAGIEKRKGKGRLQGFYGAEGNVSFTDDRRSYQYGNSFSMTDVNPNTTTDFYNHSYSHQYVRFLESKAGTGFGVGVRGFVGTEYFIAPKISLCGEFGYGLYCSLNSGYKSKTEYWDAANLEAKSVIHKNGSSFRINTSADNFGGAISLMIHL